MCFLFRENGADVKELSRLYWGGRREGDVSES